MEDKQVIKNMEYWKKKNNIPGIEGLENAGLTDGRAGSSAFQMATPGNSPNKGFFQNLGQGLMGKGKMGFINPAMWAARGVKNTLDSDPTTTNVFGGGTPNQALTQNPEIGTQTGLPIDPMIAQQQALLAQQQEGGALTMKKSPMKQEENALGGQEIAMQSQDETGNWMLDEENGELRTTEQFGGEEGILINDPDDVLGGRTMGDDDFNYRYKVEEDGSYTLISKGPSEGTESPSEEGVPQGMGPGGMDIPVGGVGGDVLQMRSPSKIYEDGKRRKNYIY